jgi:hypothetical protein
MSIALEIGRQAQTMVIWTSMVDQWLTGASVTNKMVSYNIERMTDALTGGVVVPAGILVEDDYSKNPNNSQAAHSQNRPGK